MFSSSPKKMTTASSSMSPASLLSNTNLSVRFSFALCSAATRWSLRAQIRITAPKIEKFDQKFTTMCISSEHIYKGTLINLPKPGDGKLYSLSALNDPRIDKLPYSIKILLELVVHNRDNFQVTKNDTEKIIDLENTSYKQVEIPYKPSRVLLKDFTGVSALVDLASVRDAMKNLGSDPDKINPLVPINIAFDHSAQIYDERYAY